MKVVVGTKNPVKITALKIAFEKMFNETVSIEGVSVKSNVSDQPMSFEETYQGAYNRAQNAKSSFPGADYYAGLEGGCERFHDELGVMSWVVIIDKNGNVGKGSGGMHFVPRKVQKLVEDGYELGKADDMVFHLNNSKQEMGSVGILTSGALMRTDTFVAAALRALMPFKNPEYYA